MDYKKLIIFTLILSTLFACCNMSISASDIWNADSKTYIIEGFIFNELDNENPIDFYNPHFRNNAWVELGGERYYIYERMGDDFYWTLSWDFDGTEADITISEYEVYISEHLFNYWGELSGTIPTVREIENDGTGAKEIFNTATEITTNIAFVILNAVWYDGLTFWGWILIIGFALITTFNIIKMIRNSI